MALKNKNYKIPTRFTRNQICVKYNILKEQKNNEGFEDTVKRLLKEEGKKRIKKN